MAAKESERSATHKVWKNVAGGASPTAVALSKACGSTKEPQMPDDPSTVSAHTDMQPSPAVMVHELRPRQVRAAQMLIEGRRGKDVAAAVGVSPETVSRWKAQPEFEEFTRLLLQDSVDATRLGIVSLCAESIEHLRGLVRSFNDQTALKAITLVLGKVGPVLGVISAETATTQERARLTHGSSGT